MNTTFAPAGFPRTSWTRVRQVRELQDPVAARRALEQLCHDYWYPLFAFARRYGMRAPDAQDLTQSFFAYLLAKNLFAAADPARGKLRTFLLTVFQRHLHDEQDREQAQRRGGGCEVLSLEAMRAENRYLHEPVDKMTPAKLFERNYALALFDASREKLGAAETAAGRGELYHELEPFLSLDGDVPCSCTRTALRLGQTEEATRKAISRLRKGFRQVLWRKVEATLVDPTEDDVEEELAALRAALRE